MINIPISLGELLDKISILQIKENKIMDPNKLEFVKKELKLLLDKLDEINQSLLLNDPEYLKLIFYNRTLWKLEDDIRLKEKKGEFDNDFIMIARSIYKNNDKRAEMKRNFNQRFDSQIMEVKSYENY